MVSVQRFPHVVVYLMFTKITGQTGLLTRVKKVVVRRKVLVGMLFCLKGDSDPHTIAADVSTNVRFSNGRESGGTDCIGILRCAELRWR